MTKDDFCKKWRYGWKNVYIDGQEAYFFTEEQMLNDLNQVIYSEFTKWKEFVDAQVESTIYLAEWCVQEAAAIRRRNEDN